MDNFTYSREFRGLIVRLHRGKEHWPQYRSYIEAHLGGPESRLVESSTQLVLEIEYHCGTLRGKRILDFGCGTGATTAALASVCADVVAFDTDRESIDICQRRVEEHGYQDRVRCTVAMDIAEVAPTLGTFDVILANGVFEHIPRSIKGLRNRVALALWDLLKPGGFLYISDTPNRLYPYDSHSTQLWFIPWAPAGSSWAYRRAVKRGRHAEAPTHRPGSLGLEQVGAWGATYWEILGYFKRQPAVCLNALDGHDRHIHYSVPGSKKRQLIERLLYFTVVKPFRIPMTALTPYITNLVLQKRPASATADDLGP